MISKEIKDQYVLLLLQKERVRQAYEKFPQGPRINSIYEKYTQTLKDFEQSNLRDYILNITISGFNKNDKISHHDMDDEVSAKFGDKVITDSESSQFFCYCNSKNTDTILEFLKIKYGEDFTYGVSSNNSSANTIFTNLEEAQRYAMENQIFVWDILPEEVRKAMEEFEQTEQKIRTLEVYKNNLLKQM